MSQTLAPPPAYLTAWHDTMRAAFGEAAVAKAVDRTKQRAAVLARLTTLEKTTDYAGGQQPDVAILTLRGVREQLNTMAEQITAADDPALAGRAADLGGVVDRELLGLPNQALMAVAMHAATWLHEIGAVAPAAVPVVVPAHPPADLPAPPGADLPAPPRADPAARAKRLLPIINTTEAGVAVDEAMLARMGLDGSSVLGPVKTKIAALRAEYNALLPRRELATPPTPAAAAARPAIAIATESRGGFDTGMTSIEAAMSANRQATVTDLEAVVDVIANSINKEDAGETLEDLGSWDAVKAEYRRLATADPAKAKAFMENMWWFRRMTVDREMTRLQKLYGCTWGSVGSANLESDYDVTVRTHGTSGDAVYYDYQIVKEFNDEISGRFGGTPPGTLFDTNLYAEAAVTPPNAEQRATPVGRDMGAMTEQGQDVGALMKLRRYMSWDDYEDYREKTIAAMPEAQQDLAQRQFEEADSLFFMARAEQLEEAGIAVNDIPDTPDGQKLLLQRAEQLEHPDHAEHGGEDEDHPGAKAMEVNNALYLKKMAAVRALEAALPAERDDGKKMAMLAKLRTLQADATFFAAEAYHSEGPLMHVVQAGQSSRMEVNGDASIPAERKADVIRERTMAKLRAYSPTQMLQSFNENMGDLLKDLRHYESEPFPGLGFYRSSKYLERLCDAAELLVDKLPEAARPAFAALRIGGLTPGQVKTAVAGLVDIRGEKKVFATAADPEQEKQAYAIAEMQRTFPGVTTLRDLGKVAMTYGQVVNAHVRAAVAATMTATDEAPYFRAGAAKATPTN
jgi:hypothetical protein